MSDVEWPDPEDDLSREADDEDEDLGWVRAPVVQEIPEILHSCYSKGPFEKCIECSTDLLNDHSGYVIQKVVRGGETVFEFALCLDCSQQADESLSEESRENMERHFAENGIRGLGLDACNLCASVARTSTEEYVLVALARGRYVLGGGHMVCDRCTESLEELLSESTRREMEDFTERNFPGVPASLGLPTGALAF